MSIKIVLQKTQTLADQAWEKLRVQGTIQQGLEVECSQLRHQVAHLQNEHNTLLATCALLCGALHPLYQRAASLAAQRHLLTEQLNKFESFKHQVQVLVDALSLDNDNAKTDLSSGKKFSAKRPPLLTFRIGVISVIAANRMIRFNRGNCRMFTAHDAVPGIYSTVVCTGGVQPDHSDFTGSVQAKVPVYIFGNMKLVLALQFKVLFALVSPENMVYPYCTGIPYMHVHPHISGKKDIPYFL